MKLLKPSREKLAEHYIDLIEKDYYEPNLNYMVLGPVVAMVW